MENRAGRHKNFEQHFILKEDNLRKIVDVFRRFGTKIKEETGIEPTFILRVEHEDQSFYETKDLEEVFQDENSFGNEITGLVVILERPDGNDSVRKRFYAFLRFNSDRENLKRFGPIGFTLTYESRDWCSLFSDDLETQIKRILQRGRLPLKIPKVIDLGVGMVFFSVSVSLFTMSMRKSVVSEAVIEKANTEDLVRLLAQNLLLGREAVNRWFFPAILFGMGMLIVFVEMRPIARLIEFVCRSFFLLGRRNREVSAF
ncbi:MAG: hypothetical protein HY211_00405 [Candidatus Omnitrophica bacterium]|nr:hypothetical protein [Candidatus Omnitrophota bacterium]